MKSLPLIKFLSLKNHLRDKPKPYQKHDRNSICSNMIYMVNFTMNYSTGKMEVSLLHSTCERPTNCYQHLETLKNTYLPMWTDLSTQTRRLEFFSCHRTGKQLRKYCFNWPAFGVTSFVKILTSIHISILLWFFSFVISSTHDSQIKHRLL